MEDVRRRSRPQPLDVGGVLRELMVACREAARVHELGRRQGSVSDGQVLADERRLFASALQIELERLGESTAHAPVPEPAAHGLEASLRAERDLLARYGDHVEDEDLPRPARAILHAHRLAIAARLHALEEGVPQQRDGSRRRGRRDGSIRRRGEDELAVTR